MSWRERDDDGNDLGLNLNLQLGCPSPKPPQRKPSLNGITFRSSSASRPNTSIDINTMYASPDSTIPSRNRMRSEREETKSEPHLASSEGGGDGEDSARKKVKLTDEQTALLEGTFNRKNTLTQDEKVELARQVNLETKQVKIWFQNRRARTKLKNTKAKCDSLIRACDNLTDENGRLQKELAELKARKHSSMATPPTTQTMCLQCERISMLPQSSVTRASTERHISTSGVPDQNRPQASNWLLGKLRRRE